MFVKTPLRFARSGDNASFRKFVMASEEAWFSANASVYNDFCESEW